jgi:hypothetical protein
MEVFESRHVQKTLGVSGDKLHHWVNFWRVIEPYERQRGKGRANQYSFSDVCKLVAVKMLVDMGVSLEAISRRKGCLDEIQKTGTTGWSYDSASVVLNCAAVIAEAKKIWRFK